MRSPLSITDKVSLIRADYSPFHDRLQNIQEKKSRAKDHNEWHRIPQALFSEFQETPLVIGEAGIVWSKEEDAHNT